MENQVLYNAPIATKPQPSAMVEQESQRAVAEVQAAMILARRFRRNEKEAIDRIMLACQRPALAEAAVYSYARGGTEITGPSIRLAEAIAQAWGNLQVGVREIEQRNGESTVQAYAWDLETNLKEEKTFQVKHVRHTRKESYILSDPRDIYELTANQGSRRLRACILAVIPGDIVEAAVAECEATMKAKADTGPDGVKKLVTAFAALGVTSQQIEKRIQRRLDTITPAQMVAMRKIYNSLKDGMSSTADWFEPETVQQPEEQKKGVGAAKAALRPKAKDTPPTEKTPPRAAQEAPGQKTVDTKTGEVLSMEVACPNRDGEDVLRETCGKCEMLQGCPAHE